MVSRNLVFSEKLPGRCGRRIVRLDGGFGTTWLVDPGRDLIVIVMTQRPFETPEPPRVHGEIQAAAHAALA